jgi:hypothetical protein
VTLAPIHPDTTEILDHLDFDEDVWLLEMVGLTEFQVLKPPPSITECRWEIVGQCKIDLAQVWHNSEVVMHRHIDPPLHFAAGDTLITTFRLDP